MKSNYTPDHKMFSLDAALGNIPGVAVLQKFGRNIEIDTTTADVWDGGHTVASGGDSLLWVAPTTARIHNIASSNSGDTSAGAGAKTIRVYGLTGWDTAEVSEDITMSGTANVATNNSYVIIHRMKVLTKGASGPNIGDIKATAQTDGTVTARIRAAQGQTQMAIYGIPSVKKLVLTQFYVSINRAVATAQVDFSLMFNPEPDVELTKYLVKHTDSFTTSGTSNDTHTFDPPNVFDGPGIILARITSSQNDIDVSAGFGGYLVDA